MTIKLITENQIISIFEGRMSIAKFSFEQVLETVKAYLYSTNTNLPKKLLTKFDFANTANTRELLEVINGAPHAGAKAELFNHCVKLAPQYLDLPSLIKTVQEQGEEVEESMTMTFTTTTLPKEEAPAQEDKTLEEALQIQEEAEEEETKVAEEEAAEESFTNELSESSGNSFHTIGHDASNSYDQINT